MQRFPIFVDEHHVYLLRLHCWGLRPLYHVADCSTECVFVAEAFYSRKICAKALLSVSAQIQEDLDRVGLQSRYEISVRNYKVALCFFPALVLQPTSQNTLVGTKGA